MIRAALSDRVVRLTLWFGCILATLLLAPTPAQAAGGTPDCGDSVTETSYTYSCQDAAYRGGLSGSRTIVFPAGAQRGVTAVSGTVWSAANYASYSPNPANWGNLLPFVQNNTLTVSWSSGVPPGYENSAISWTVTVSFLPRPIITSCSASPNPVTLANGQATTTLTGLSSDPAGGSVTKYDWDFGDGTTGVSDAGSLPTNRVASVPATDVPPLAQALAPPLAHAGGGGFLLTPTATAALTANPTGIFAGESSTLSWSASGIDRSTFTITATNKIGTRTATLSFPSGALTVATESPGSAPVAAATTPTIAQRIASFIGRSLHPTVAEAAGGFLEPTEPPVLSYFTASSSQAGAPQGSSVTLRWEFYNAESITSNFGASTSTGSKSVQLSYFTVTSNFLPTTPATGSQAVTPTVSTLYSITAADLNGEVTAYAGVAVNRPPISHPYTQAGTFTVTVTATSSSGNTGSGTCTVTVTGQSPDAVTLDPPVASCDAVTGRTSVVLRWSASAQATSYRVKRTLDGTESTVTTTTDTSYTDTFGAPPGVPYRYVVEAVNGSGATSSTNTVSAVTSCPLAMSLRLDPASLPGIAPGGIQLFTVIPTINGLVVSSTSSVGGQLTVSWRVSRAEAGAVTQSSTNPFQASYVAGSVTGEYPGAVIATVTFTPSSGSPVTQEVAADVTIATPGISGDVYSGGDVKGLTLDPTSVVSAKGAITGITGTTFQIPGYTTNNALQWEDSGSTKGARTLILDQAARLRKERVNANHVLGSQPAGFTISGTFNLNPKATGAIAYATHSVNPTQPEGQVWWVPGNLTIKDATFVGRGTILVEGSVSITGSNVSYTTNSATAGSLGIILLGDGSVTVDASVTKLVGAYFVPDGSIQFSASAPIGDGSTETTVSVPVDGTIVSSATPLQANGTYQLTAVGEATVRTSGVTLFADAEYFYEPGQQPAAPFGGDINASSCGSSPTTDNGIETGVNLTTQVPALKQTRWGAFTATHTYQATVTGTGSPLQLRFIDCSYTDNSGSPLSVTITPVSLPSPSAPLTATGLFVGNAIQLQRTPASIRYDARVSTATPPGFGVVTLPGIKETAP